MVREGQTKWMTVPYLKDNTYCQTSLPIEWIRKMGIKEGDAIHMTMEKNKIIIESYAEIIKSELKFSGNMIVRGDKILEKTEEKSKNKKTEFTEDEAQEIEGLRKKEESAIKPKEKTDELEIVEVVSKAVTSDEKTDELEVVEVISETADSDEKEEIQTTTENIEEKDELGTFDWTKHEGEEQEPISLEEFNKEKEKLESETK